MSTDGPVLPDAWESMRAAIWSWADGQVSPLPVIWAEQSAPAPPRPYAALQVTSLPSSGAHRDERRQRIASYRVTVSQLVALSSYTITVLGVSITFATGSSPTLAQAQASLVAAVNGSAVNTQAVASPAPADGTFAVEITPITFGVDLRVLTTDARLTTLAELVLDQEGDRDFVVSCAIFAADPDSAVGAQISSQALAMTLYSSLPTEAVHAAFSAAGLATTERLPLQSLDRVVGTDFEARSTFSIRFRARSRATSPSTWIEQATAVGVVT